MHPQTAVNIALALSVVFLSALLGYEKGAQKRQTCPDIKPRTIIVQAWDPKNGPHPACIGLKAGPCL